MNYLFYFVTITATLRYNAFGSEGSEKLNNNIHSETPQPWDGLFSSLKSALFRIIISGLRLAPRIRVPVTNLHPNPFLGFFIGP